MKTFLVLGVALLTVLPTRAASNPVSETGRPIYKAPVPAGESELLPYASFEIRDARRSIRDGRVLVEYTLPFELTGVAQKIELEGPLTTQGTFQMTGSHADAVCDQRQCSLNYKDLVTDLPGLRRSFRAAGLSPQETELRMRVAGHFVEDPHGLLIYEESEATP